MFEKEPVKFAYGYPEALEAFITARLDLFSMVLAPNFEGIFGHCEQLMSI